MPLFHDMDVPLLSPVGEQESPNTITSEGGSGPGGGLGGPDGLSGKVEGLLVVNGSGSHACQPGAICLGISH